MRKKTLIESAKFLKIVLGLLIVFSILIAPMSSYAAGGGKPATKLVNVADTRDMPSGFSKALADLYNTNLWLFGLVVVVIMAGMGLGLGLIFDRLMQLTGIELGKLDHHE